jgi:hypothetical protein
MNATIAANVTSPRITISSAITTFHLSRTEPGNQEQQHENDGEGPPCDRPWPRCRVDVGAVEFVFRILGGIHVFTVRQGRLKGPAKRHKEFVKS